jgi:hypothetical protein
MRTNSNLLITIDLIMLPIKILMNISYKSKKSNNNILREVAATIRLDNLIIHHPPNNSS